MDEATGQVDADWQIAEAMAAERESLSQECRADAARPGQGLPGLPGLPRPGSLRPRERPAQAVVTGFGYSIRVVVAAALIMTSVFAGFVGNSQILVKMIGFGQAVAVLVDAFVVRATIAPAVLALLGERAWWLPRWLDRALPHLDIEG